MALSGLDIFKLLPKTNCKKCGMPTCLAFAMALAQKKVSLDQCPDATQAARDTPGRGRRAADAPGHASARATPPPRPARRPSSSATRRSSTAPPWWRSPCPTASTPRPSKARAAAIQAFAFERIGLPMPVNAIAVTNPSGDAAKFAAAAAVAAATGKAVILVTEKPEAAAAALEKIKASKPLLCGATAATADAMAKLAKDAGVPAGGPRRRRRGPGGPHGEGPGRRLRGPRPVPRRPRRLGRDDRPDAHPAPGPQEIVPARSATP